MSNKTSGTGRCSQMRIGWGIEHIDTTTIPISSLLNFVAAKYECPEGYKLKDRFVVQLMVNHDITSSCNGERAKTGIQIQKFIDDIDIIWPNGGIVQTAVNGFVDDAWDIDINGGNYKDLPFFSETHEFEFMSGSDIKDRIDNMPAIGNYDSREGSFKVMVHTGYTGEGTHWGWDTMLPEGIDRETELYRLMLVMTDSPGKMRNDPTASEYDHTGSYIIWAYYDDIKDKMDYVDPVNVLEAHNLPSLEDFNNYADHSINFLAVLSPAFMDTADWWPNLAKDTNHFLTVKPESDNDFFSDHYKAICDMACVPIIPPTQPTMPDGPTVPTHKPNPHPPSPTPPHTTGDSTTSGADTTTTPDTTGTTSTTSTSTTTTDGGSNTGVIVGSAVAGAVVLAAVAGGTMYMRPASGNPVPPDGNTPGMNIEYEEKEAFFQMEPHDML